MLPRLRKEIPELLICISGVCAVLIFAVLLQRKQKLEPKSTDYETDSFFNDGGSGTYLLCLQ